MKRRFFKTKLLALSVVAIGLAIFAYGRLYSHFPHSLRVASSTVHAHGRYYHVPFDRVTSCILIGDHIVVSGEVLTSLSEGRVESGRIFRNPPVPADEITGRTERWTLKTDSYSEHVFARRDSTDELAISPPPGTADFHCNIYDLQRGRTLIIFASGNWKGGPRSYYGYALIEPKA